MKTCTKCKVEKEDTEFTKPHSKCKVCRALFNREHREESRPREKKYKQTTGRLAHNASVARYKKTEKGKITAAKCNKKYRQKPEVIERLRAYEKARPPRKR